MLAMAVGQLINLLADLPLSRAGSLLQGCGLDTITLTDHKSLWEPSLLAMAVGQSTKFSADTPLSRASSAPAGDLGWGIKSGGLLRLGSA
ncbi:hypothetical protein C9I50_00710 [Pseudomonas prosekii]|nr:hypothetical protein C9I50_00710 [Pseudomonas prosekii]